MRKRVEQGSLILVLFLLCNAMDLIITKEPWVAISELPSILKWGYGLVLAFALNLPPIIAAAARREWEDGLMEKKRYLLLSEIALAVVGAAFTLNMAAAVSMNSCWETVFKHTAPLLTSVLLLLVTYAVYEPLDTRLDILEYQYDILYTLVTDKQQEIRMMGDPREEAKGSIAIAIDQYTEYIDRLNANAKEKKIKVRRYLMEQLDESEDTAELVRSCQFLAEGKDLTIDPEKEYREFASRRL